MTKTDLKIMHVDMLNIRNLRIIPLFFDKYEYEIDFLLI